MRHVGAIAAGGIIVIIVLVFFLAPLVPYTFSSVNFAGYSGNVSAQVSPSFYALGCGIVFNPTQSGSLGGITVSHQIYSGGEWQCKNGSH
ncbi:MAG: hypothetical protein OK456_10410 [Thaumarchaeota archaeon]|nr:hypothetical protein [Nitrososphaerota archaeon]